MKSKKTAAVLIRSFWLGMLLLGLWANIFILWSTRMYASHAQWFNLSYHEFELFMYGAMIFFKLCLLLFFLIPYLALKLLQYSRKKT